MPSPIMMSHLSARQRQETAFYMLDSDDIWVLCSMWEAILRPLDALINGSIALEILYFAFREQFMIPWDGAECLGFLNVQPLII